MVYRLWAIAIVTLAAILLGGCTKESEPVPPQAVQQAPITAENLDSELDKMEAEVDADIAAEQ